MSEVLFSISACSYFHWLVVLYTWKLSTSFPFAIELLNGFSSVYCYFEFYLMFPRRFLRGYCRLKLRIRA